MLKRNTMTTNNKDYNIPDPNREENAPSRLNNRDVDLPDNAHDEERMQPEEVILDLPDVKDIPGQEFIHPPEIDSFSDTTIASDDEEGVGIFEDQTPEDDNEAIMGTDADVSDTEKDLLEKAGTDIPGSDDTLLRRAELDQTDDEGELINEGGLATNVSGSDLDMSGVDTDDRMENIGEEDEENNQYSLGSDDNDNVTEGTP
jgi:hypothetical protein